MSPPSSVLTHVPDKFKTGRIMAIQPNITSSELDQGVMLTEDPTAIAFLTNLLRLWSFERHDLPTDFVDEVTLTQLARQPIALVDVQLELTHRELQPVRRPYSGGSVDTNTWQSDDPFELLPTAGGEFPVDARVSIERVPGGEIIEGCSTCQSAGATRCRACEGGKVACPDCGGTQQANCERCLGVGRHIGARGNLINCQLCGTRGTRRCTRCVRGAVDCETCHGRGSLTCSVCEGHGNIHTYSQIESETRTQASAFGICAENWPFDDTCLIGDTTELHTEEWTWPGGKQSEMEFSSWVPSHILRPVERFIYRRIEHCENNVRKNERISAIRVTLSGTYAYAVDYEYRNSKERVYVAGLSNRVFSERGEVRKAGMLGSLRRLGYHVVNALGNYTPPVDRTYLTAVQTGQVHIGDTRCLIPAVAKVLAVAVDVTEQGYELVSRTNPSLRIQLDFDFNPAGHPLVCITRMLCQAERQRFQQALQLNKRLSFGRIAISETDGVEFFSIVDRRLYKPANAPQLSKIIKTIMAESQKIIDGKLLR